MVFDWVTASLVSAAILAIVDVVDSHLLAKRLPVHIYYFDPSLAPAGKTALRVKLNSDYEYWNQLREAPERYKAEKEQIADKVVALLDKRFPGLSAQIVMRDVVTPITFERYTGNRRDSYNGMGTHTGNYRYERG